MTDRNPYELPPGYTIDWYGLRDPDGRTLATEHLGDGLWFSGGDMGSGIDTHPIRRRDGALPSYACHRDLADHKGFGLRRAAFIASLQVDHRLSEGVRQTCWDLVDAGEMAPYDEAHIRRLIAERLRAEIERLQAMLTAVE